MKSFQKKIDVSIFTHASRVSGALFLFSAVLNTAALDAWQTVDSWRMNGYNAVSADAGADLFGNVFTVGYAAGPVPGLTGEIRSSKDGGTTWSAEGFTMSGATATKFIAFAADSANPGVLYAGGVATPGSPWFILRSADDGASWSLDDSFQPSSGLVALTTGGTGDVFACGDAAGSNWVTRKRDITTGQWSTVDMLGTVASGVVVRAVAADPHAGVFAVGDSLQGKYLEWTVRRSIDGGHTWTTADAFAGSSAYGIGIVTDGAGQRTIYATGVGPTTKKGSGAAWIVRASTDDGAHWTTVDNFQYARPGYYTSARYVCSDLSGTVYVLGRAGDSKNAIHWIVRKRVPGSTVWELSDDYVLKGTVNPGIAEPTGLTRDLAGNVFATGYTDDTSAGIDTWVTRELLIP